MPKIDIPSLTVTEGAPGLPALFRESIGQRRKRALSDGGLPGDEVLEDFGVNLAELPPGASSSLRHWHSDEDEFVYILEGELVLLTDDGEEVLKTGEAAVFPKGDENGHQLVNKSAAPARYLEVGGRSNNDVCCYPDNDLHKLPETEGGAFTHKNGAPYEEDQDD